MGISRNTGAGNNYAAIGFYDANNEFIIGGTRTAPSAGNQDGSSFTRVYGVQSASPTVPEPDTVVIEGDDGVVDEIDFDSIGSRSFTVDMAIQDFTLATEIDGTETEEMLGGQTMPLDTGEVSTRQAAVILQSRGTNEATGEPVWSGTFIPRASLKFLGRVAFEGRTAGAYRFQVTPKRASHKVWGVTLSASTDGATRERQRPFAFPYPVWIDVFTGDGAETDFNLTHTPAALNRINAYVDRVAVTVDSLASNVITMASAPGNGRQLIVPYLFTQFND